MDKRGLARLLRFFGWLWLALVTLLVIGGSAAYVFSHSAPANALRELAGQFSPFNVTFYLLLVLLVGPAGVFFFLAQSLERPT